MNASMFDSEEVTGAIARAETILVPSFGSIVIELMTLTREI